MVAERAYDGVSPGPGRHRRGRGHGPGPARLPPPTAQVTTARLAVVRLHGRSPHWGTGTKEDRFRHTYTVPELMEWLPRVRTLAEQAEEVHVLFNNCCADSAAQAARTMAELLTAHLPHQRGAPSPGQPPRLTGRAAEARPGRSG